ncbi:hypothetical protein CEV31_3165 [Brucella thiophenivorans]|uniref:Uncharacterized protein n=1 Tax=Brucella thiophenivorans TaxID=571255 RepID=A0A256FK35_9HYPH|nr:hypothetical protein CEV31_3165 [Brucella thiophenivorans]
MEASEHRQMNIEKSEVAFKYVTVNDLKKSLMTFPQTRCTNKIGRLISG